MIKWIFFDVGNVIFNDDPGMAIIYERLHRAILEAGIEITFKELLTEREELILGNYDGKHHHTLGSKYLGQRRWEQLRAEILEDYNNNYFKYNKLLEGIVPQILLLSHNYSLGLAGNQVNMCRHALETIDLLKFFSVVGLSEEIGIEKPSPKFFEKILSMAQAQAEECVMIGDRVDHDIVPSKSIGMKAILIEHDLTQKGYEPVTEYQKQYFAGQLRASVQKIKPKDPKDTNEQADVTIYKVAEIADAVKMLENSENCH